MAESTREQYDPGGSPGDGVGEEVLVPPSETVKHGKVWVVTSY